MKIDRTIEIYHLTALESKTLKQYHSHSRTHRESMLAGFPQFLVSPDGSQLVDQHANVCYHLCMTLPCLFTLSLCA